MTGKSAGVEIGRDMFAARRGDKDAKKRLAAKDVEQPSGDKLETEPDAGGQSE